MRSSKISEDKDDDFEEIFDDFDLERNEDLSLESDSDNF